VRASGDAVGPGRPADTRSIRLALCGLTQFLDDIVTALLSREPDVQIIARIAPGDDLRGDFEATGADLLICALAAPDMQAAWDRSLERHPPLVVLNIADDASSGALYALEASTEIVRDLTAGALLTLVAQRSPGSRRPPPDGRNA
jgi:hypothetical protein